MKIHHRLFRLIVTAMHLTPPALRVGFRSFVIAFVALGLSPSAYSNITIQSYWPLGEAAAIGTDTASGTANPFNKTDGSTVLTASPSSAAGSTAYAHTTGTNYQGIWMYGPGSTAQTVPADNWGVQFNVRVTTLPASGYRAVLGMAEGVSGGLVIEANNVSGTVYWDVNKQALANYIIPRNASVTVAANTWYNLALVKSGGTTSFYVNGAFVGSNTGAINTSGLISLGFNQNIGTSHLSGDYDEARFFTFDAGAFTTSDLSMTKRSVTYSGNSSDGGSVPVDSSLYFPGTPVTVLGAGTLTRAGYVFTGWNTQELGGGTSYSPSATFSIGDANTALYAQWVAVTATLTAASTFPDALGTIYGTPSASTGTAVSGVNLLGDITATAPSHLEVSNDNITFGTTAIFTESNASASGTLYVRLKANAPVSASLYDSQAVTLTSSAATPITVATTASGNAVTPKALTVVSATAQDKMHDGTPDGTVIGTLETAQAFGSGTSSDGIPYIGDTLTVSAPGTFADTALGGPYEVTAGTFTLGGASAANYSLIQPTGFTLSASIVNTATWTQVAGGAWTDSANWLNGVIGTGVDNTADFSTLNLTATTTVTLSSPQTVGYLLFGDNTTSDNNWVVSGSTLTLAASTPPTIDVANQTTTISSALAGTSGMTKTGAGILALRTNISGVMNLTVNNGTLKLAVTSPELAYNNPGGVGDGGTITVNAGATLDLAGKYNLGYTQPLVIHGGTVHISCGFLFDGQQYTENVRFTGGGTITGNAMRLGELGGGVIGVSGSAVATIQTDFFLINASGKTGTFDVGATGAGGADLTVSGVIADYSGATGLPLIKTGAGTLAFTGANTYIGDTTVSQGTLSVNGNSIANTNKLIINSGLVDVATAANETVNSLYYGTTQQAAGTYGSTSSDATHKDNTRFSGAGIVTVLTGPYDIWSNGSFANAFNDKTSTGNPDSDALTNLQEYAFGTDPTVSTSGSITYANGAVTAHGLPTTQITNVTNGVDFRAVFGRRKDYVAAGLTYTVQFSAGLDVWVTSAAEPTVLASDATMDAVSVPYPLFITTARGVEKPTFFRVGVNGATTPQQQP
jgi:uncharacterized repeat protein (TIGR02543 family)